MWRAYEIGAAYEMAVNIGAGWRADLKLKMVMGSCCFARDTKEIGFRSAGVVKPASFVARHMIGR